MSMYIYWYSEARDRIFGNFSSSGGVLDSIHCVLPHACFLVTSTRCMIGGDLVAAYEKPFRSVSVFRVLFFHGGLSCLELNDGNVRWNDRS